MLAGTVGSDEQDPWPVTLGQLQQTSDPANPNNAEETQRFRSNVTFVRAAVTGVEHDSKIFPLEIPPYDENSTELSIATHPLFLKQFRNVQRTRRPVVLKKEDIEAYAELLDKTSINDGIACIVMLPILTMDGSLRAIAIAGLNPRKAYDEDYQVFLDLFQAQISHGITSIRLVHEELRQSRFFAALIKRKNEELHQLLDARTQELRSSELKFLKMAEISPTGIWTTSLE